MNIERVPISDILRERAECYSGQRLLDLFEIASIQLSRSELLHFVRGLVRRMLKDAPPAEVEAWILEIEGALTNQGGDNG